MATDITWSGLFNRNLEEEIRAKVTAALKSSAENSPILLEDLVCDAVQFGDAIPELSFGEALDSDSTYLVFTFVISYKGNAAITLRTRIDANKVHDRSVLGSRRAAVFGSVAAHQGYELPLRITLTDWDLHGNLIIKIDLHTKEVQVTLEENPLHDFKLLSNFDVIAGAGNSVRDAVTTQIRGAVDGLLSKPQTFRFGGAPPEEQPH
eukprot:c33634_g1_i1.p1 GENE.c33634_g1_i1~~c33634_g1_i1.p1  ORF type:complete len:207 (+),score=47.20 c33634_g1_i1:39-659(+)